jgi:hypothetical protein
MVAVLADVTALAVLYSALFGGIEAAVAVAGVMVMVVLLESARGR